jgi:hypothetical protein
MLNAFLANMVMWMSWAPACMFVKILAFNRMMVFVNEREASRLFDGAKAYVWIAVAWLFAFTCCARFDNLVYF